MLSAPLPAAYVNHGGVVLSGEVPRSVAAMFLPGVIQEMLRRDLREAAQGAYAPWSCYEPVDTDVAVVCAGSDVARSLLPSLVPQVMRVLQTLRAQGPPPEVIDDAVASALQSVRDPHQAAALAWRAALADLAGIPVLTFEEAIAELEGVTSDQVAAALKPFGESLLLGVPGEATWHDEFPMLRMPTTQRRTRGSRHRSRGFPNDRSVLSVDDAAVHLSGSGGVQTIAFADVAGILALPDGRRQVIDHEGWGLAIEPTLWHRGEKAVRLIDENVPADRVMTFPARKPEERPSPPSSLQTWLRWFRGLLGPRFVRLLYLPLLFVFWSPAATRPMMVIAAAWACVFLVRFETQQRRRQ